MTNKTDSKLSPLANMFLDTFPEEAQAFCEEKGYELQSTKDPVQAEIGGRYEIPGEYAIKPLDKSE